MSQFSEFYDKDYKFGTRKIVTIYVLRMENTLMSQKHADGKVDIVDTHQTALLRQSDLDQHCCTYLLRWI